MISFKIPTKDLRLFLIALNMNFHAPEPDYIFQVPDGFEIVYTKDIGHVSAIDRFIEDMTKSKCDATGMQFKKPPIGHSPFCDLDPETLKVRRDIGAGFEFTICLSCASRIPSLQNRPDPLPPSSKGC